MKYCRKLFEGHGATDRHLKKDKCWNWTEKCQESFEELKRRMVTTPILKLADFERPF